MPELPEVETIICGLLPCIKNLAIQRSIVRCDRLRLPIPKLNPVILQQKVINIARRGKYILIYLQTCTIIIHLGMSGRLCLLSTDEPVQRHDHVDIIFTNKQILRYTDPRRFGLIQLTLDCPLKHPLLSNLGIEPLTDRSEEHTS